MKTESPADPCGTAEGRAAASDRAAAGAAEESASRAFQDAAIRIREIREYVSYYISAKADALKLTARTIVIYAALGIIGLLAVVSAVVAAVVLLLLGLADGIGAALGGRSWIGDLIVAVVVLTVIGLGAKFAISSLFKSFRKQTVAKYESRKRNQHEQFGHDVKRRTQHPGP